MSITYLQASLLSSLLVVAGIATSHYVFLWYGWTMNRSATVAAIVGSAAWVLPTVSVLAVAGELNIAFFVLSQLVIAGIATLFLKFLDRYIPRRQNTSKPLTWEKFNDAKDGRTKR